MRDFLGMGRIIKEQRLRIDRLELENRLLFESIKGNSDDLATFNRALAKALDEASKTSDHQSPRSQ